MANDFAISYVPRLNRVIIGCQLPVAELVFEALSKTDTSYMSDEEYTLYSEFKSKLLDMVREMK